MFIHQVQYSRGCASGTFEKPVFKQRWDSAGAGTGPGGRSPGC